MESFIGYLFFSLLITDLIAMTIGAVNLLRDIKKLPIAKQLTELTERELVDLRATAEGLVKENMLLPHHVFIMKDKMNQAINEAIEEIKKREELKKQKPEV